GFQPLLLSEGIPAAGNEALLPAIDSNEPDSPAALDLANCRDLGEVRRLPEPLRVFGWNGEEKLVVFAAVQRHLQRVKFKLGKFQGETVRPASRKLHAGNAI